MSSKKRGTRVWVEVLGLIYGTMSTGGQRGKCIFVSMIGRWHKVMENDSSSRGGSKVSNGPSGRVGRRSGQVAGSRGQ